MSKIYGDLSGIGITLLFALMMWSSATSREFSIGIVIFMIVFLLISNILTILFRQGSNFIDRVIYTLLFFGFSSILFAVFVSDDYGVFAALLFFLFQVGIVLFLSVVLRNEFGIKKYECKTQNFFVFIASVIIIVIELTIIVY